MKQTTPDDALVGLLSAVIYQAVDDYRLLQKHGAVSQSGEVRGNKFGRRLGRTAYRHYDGIVREHEAAELVRFFTSPALDFLCSAIGHQSCRIRRVLQIEKGVQP